MIKKATVSRDIVSREFNNPIYAGLEDLEDQNQLPITEKWSPWETKRMIAS